jgi:hypothetical protein
MWKFGPSALGFFFSRMLTLVYEGKVISVMFCALMSEAYLRSAWPWLSNLSWYIGRVAGGRSSVTESCYSNVHLT